MSKKTHPGHRHFGGGGHIKMEVVVSRYSGRVEMARVRNGGGGSVSTVRKKGVAHRQASE